MEFTDALEAVAATHGTPDGIINHSMGAATTAMVLRDGLKTRRVVFIAPGPDPVGTTRQLERVLGFGRRTRERFFERLSDLAGRPLDDFNALLIDSTAEVPPALVIHDRQDKESPYDDGVRLAAVWPEAELVSTDGLGHQRILLDDAVIELTVDYVTT
jgi:pimeloyl-ACP methyl ester carboxylesterase